MQNWHFVPKLRGIQDSALLVEMACGIRLQQLSSGKSVLQSSVLNTEILDDAGGLAQPLDGAYGRVLGDLIRFLGHDGVLWCDTSMPDSIRGIQWDKKADHGLLPQLRRRRLLRFKVRVISASRLVFIGDDLRP